MGKFKNEQIIQEEQAISQEKQEWLKEIGAKEFDEPMNYYVGTNWLYSKGYINRTPLEDLKAIHDKRLVAEGEPVIDDSDLSDLEKRIKCLEKEMAELRKEVQPLKEFFKALQEHKRNAIHF